jgi:hypothetical protein
VLKIRSFDKELTKKTSIYQKITVTSKSHFIIIFIKFKFYLQFWFLPFSLSCCLDECNWRKCVCRMRRRAVRTSTIELDVRAILILTFHQMSKTLNWNRKDTPDVTNKERPAPTVADEHSRTKNQISFNFFHIFSMACTYSSHFPHCLKNLCCKNL